MTQEPDQYDTPWKEAVERYFPEFMAFYFPDAHAQIDWSQRYTFDNVAPATTAVTYTTGTTTTSNYDSGDTITLIGVDAAGNSGEMTFTLAQALSA